VAELVDAQDSGSCGVTPVGVRFPPFAPSRTFNTYHTNPSFSNVYSPSRVIKEEPHALCDGLVGRRLSTGPCGRELKFYQRSFR
jgi:hypothetical protein